MSSTTVTDHDLARLIAENEYITNCSSNSNKDLCSLSYLITRPMSQSECIRLGIGYEKLLVEIILQNTKLMNAKTQNKKGEKEKDHLFVDTENKIVYYAELKANINLDTEKSKSTYNKCLDIVKELEQEYSDYEINWCLLGFRFLNYRDIPSTIQKKYTPITNHLFGINQYLELLHVDLHFTEDRYARFLNNIADAMFCTSSS